MIYNKKCEDCNANFTTSHINTRFCKLHWHRSKDKCWNWKGGSLFIIKCRQCGKEFNVNFNAIKRNKQYCSLKCFGIMNIKLRNIKRNVHSYLKPKSSNDKRKGTSIEIAVEDWLISKKLMYEKQVTIKDKNGKFVARVDFIVNGVVVIQTDGLYWHKNRLDYDLCQDKKLIDLGYAVVRISDKEMKEKEIGHLIRFKCAMVDFHNFYRVTWQEDGCINRHNIEEA